MRLNNNFVSIFLKISIFLYPLLFIWQCGDLTDTGFFAYNFQNFFNNLQLGNTNSVSFFADFIGAIWFRMFPTLGIIGLKFLYLIFFYLIVIFIYFILKDLTKNKNLLLLGILCGIAFSERWTMLVFSRDIASWFFLIVSGYFMIKGQNRQKLLFFYFSGIFFAIACLSRFPNIILFALLPLALLYEILYKERNINYRHFLIFLKKYLLFILGFLSLLAIFFGALKYFNLAQTFLLNMDLLGTNEKSSYATLGLLRRYLKEFIVFLPHLLVITSLMLTTPLIFDYAKITKKYFPFVIYILLLCYVVFINYADFSYSSKIKYLIPAFCFSPLMFSLIKKDKFSFIVIIMLIMAIAQVAGTNTGLFLKLCYGFMFLIPISIVIIANQKNIIFGNISINTKVILIVGVIYILFLSLFARIGWIYNVDSGLTCRLRATYPIKHDLMKGILTTKNNASHINEMCGAIESNIKKENTLFIYGHQPMFYYLTQHQPPVKKFWLTNKFVQVDELFLSINESVSLTGKWPMIVDTKQNIMGEIGEIKLAEFLKENNYKLIKNESDFNIWNKMQE
jgi:hypothetical protein